jgi:hypothetical protein
MKEILKMRRMLEKLRQSREIAVFLRLQHWFLLENLLKNGLIGSIVVISGSA